MISTLMIHRLEDFFSLSSMALGRSVEFNSSYEGEAFRYFKDVERLFKTESRLFHISLVVMKMCDLISICSPGRIATLPREYMWLGGKMPHTPTSS